MVLLVMNQLQFTYILWKVVRTVFLKVLNEALRSENRPALKPWFPFLKLFDMALNKLPTVKGNIWREVPGDVSGMFTKDEVLT